MEREKVMGSVFTCKLNPCCGNIYDCEPPWQHSYEPMEGVKQPLKITNIFDKSAERKQSPMTLYAIMAYEYTTNCRVFATDADANGRKCSFYYEGKPNCNQITLYTHEEARNYLDKLDQRALVYDMWIKDWQMITISA